MISSRHGEGHHRDSIAKIHAPDKGRVQENGLPEIDLGVLENRIHDHLESFYQLTATISPDRFVWQRWPPGEADVHLSCTILQSDIAYDVGQELPGVQNRGISSAIWG